MNCCQPAGTDELAEDFWMAPPAALIDSMPCPSTVSMVTCNDSWGSTDSGKQLQPASCSAASLLTEMHGL